MATSDEDNQKALERARSVSRQIVDWYERYKKKNYTFTSDSFEILIGLLSQLEAYGLSFENVESANETPEFPATQKVTAEDYDLIQLLQGFSSVERKQLFRRLSVDLTSEEVNLLLGRRQALERFEANLTQGQWREVDWQDFFEKQPWIFGYGLDYRVMRPFDREMVVGSGGTDGRNKPIVDFLMTFTDYTVLVEIKRPETPIFQSRKSGRAGTWRFSIDFMDAISQVLEQKAEWISSAKMGEHYSKAGTFLDTRTRDTKCILVLGNKQEFISSGSQREASVKLDTFELFRRSNQALEIVTFDELFERAKFIARNQPSIPN